MSELKVLTEWLPITCDKAVIKENKEKFDHNYEMIKFHDLTKEENNFEINEVTNINWEDLKIKFSEMEFNSIIAKEKSWEKYIKTFSKLERNRHDN